MGIFGTLAEDFRAKAHWLYGRGDRRAIVRAALADGLGATLLFRAMEWATRWRLAPLALLYYKLNAVLFHVVIGRGARIAPGLVLVHGFGIVINGMVRAGRNVVLEHGVTIGAEAGACPVLGDQVFVGAGAAIVGAVAVGAGARIGANAVVVKDVPENATAVGAPAHVVRVREGARPAYLCAIAPPADGGRGDGTQA
jgi:serine O-acetyltransferase